MESAVDLQWENFGPAVDNITLLGEEFFETIDEICHQMLETYPDMYNMITACGTTDPSLLVPPSIIALRLSAKARNIYDLMQKETDSGLRKHLERADNAVSRAKAGYFLAKSPVGYDIANFPSTNRLSLVGENSTLYFTLPTPTTNRSLDYLREQLPEGGEDELHALLKGVCAYHHFFTGSRVEQEPIVIDYSEGKIHSIHLPGMPSSSPGFDVLTIQLYRRVENYAKTLDCVANLSRDGKQGLSIPSIEVKESYRIPTINTVEVSSSGNPTMIGEHAALFHDLSTYISDVTNMLTCMEQLMDKSIDAYKKAQKAPQEQIEDRVSQLLDI